MFSNKGLTSAFLALLLIAALVIFAVTFGRTFITPAHAVLQRDVLFAEVVREIGSYNAVVGYRDMFAKTSDRPLDRTEQEGLSGLLQGRHLPWEKEKRLYEINLRFTITLTNKAVTVLEVSADLGNPIINCTFRAKDTDPLVFSVKDDTGIIDGLYRRMR